MFKTLELPGGLAPLALYQGFALDPVGALSSSQTPRPIMLHPPFLIPGYGPAPTRSEIFTLLISTIRPVYLLNALTIGHISDSDEVNCYFNSHDCRGPMHPLPQTSQLMIRMYSNFLYMYYIYACTFVCTSSQM